MSNSQTIKSPPPLHTINIPNIGFKRLKYLAGGQLFRFNKKWCRKENHDGYSYYVNGSRLFQYRHEDQNKIVAIYTGEGVCQILRQFGPPTQHQQAEQ